MPKMPIRPMQIRYTATMTFNSFGTIRISTPATTEITGVRLRWMFTGYDSMALQDGAQIISERPRMRFD
jgi:hypothetical protein